MKRCREWVANLRLKTKFLIILCFSLLLACGVTLLATFAVFHQYDEELYRNTSQLLSMAVDAIESDLSVIDQAGVWIVSNPDIQGLLSDTEVDFQRREPVIVFGAASKKIYEVLNNYTRKNAYMSSTSIYVKGQRFSVGQPYANWSPEDAEQMRSLAALGEGQAVWTPSGKDDGTLYYTREIRDIGSMKLQAMGTLVIQIDLRQIVNDRLKESPNLSYAPELSMLDSGGITLFEDFPIRQTAESFPNENGFRRAILGGKDYFITYATHSRFDFQYATYLPIDAIASTLRLLNLVVLLASVLALLASIGLSSLLVSQIIRHFNVLVDKMRLFTGGRLQEIKKSPYVNRRDELGYLHRSFDKMAEDFQRLVQENYLKQLAIKDARIKSLQAQINPHFLFNILQTINWKAKAGKQEDISRITEALGKMLRYNLQEQAPLVPLKKELEITRYYVSIQKYRYGDRLCVSFHVPQAWENTLIPPMALQNLVENSIKYGLENMLTPCHIEVCMEERGKDVILSVEDNGPGLNQTAFEQATQEKPEGTGIGHSNIEQRIHLLLGEEYGIRGIDTGHGARIELLLPGPEEEAEQ